MLATSSPARIGTRRVQDVIFILLSAFYTSDNLFILPYQKELVESLHPCREKLKEDYSLLESSSFQVEVAVNPSLSKLSTANCQLSTVNCQLSTVNVPQLFADPVRLLRFLLSQRRC